jgi:hypothetical protein
MITAEVLIFSFFIAALGLFCIGCVLALYAAWLTTRS